MKLVRVVTACMILCSPAYADPTNVLILGDSITLGSHIDKPARTFVALLQRSGIRVHDISVGGAAATTMLPRVIETVNVQDGQYTIFKDQLDLVIIMLGVNDVPLGASEFAFRNAYSNFLQSINAPVVCVTPFWFYDEGVANSSGLTVADYRRFITEECTGTVVDGLSIIPIDPQFEAPGLPTKYTIEGVHPNKLGHRRIYKALRDIIHNEIQ